MQYNINDDHWDREREGGRGGATEGGREATLYNANQVIEIRVLVYIHSAIKNNTIISQQKATISKLKSK